MFTDKQRISSYLSPILLIFHYLLLIFHCNILWIAREYPKASLRYRLVDVILEVHCTLFLKIKLKHKYFERKVYCCNAE